MCTLKGHKMQLQHYFFQCDKRDHGEKATNMKKFNSRCKISNIHDLVAVKCGACGLKIHPKTKVAIQTKYVPSQPDLIKTAFCTGPAARKT